MKLRRFIIKRTNLEKKNGNYVRGVCLNFPQHFHYRLFLSFLCFFSTDQPNLPIFSPNPK